MKLLAIEKETTSVNWNEESEVLINEYYAELGKYWLDEDQCVPCFYVEVGDQVQGVISDFHTAIRAFERARHAVAYRLKSGLGIVKIDEQTNLTAGMSPSGHLPGKMDSPASSPEIFRRMSANAKAPVRLPGCLRSGA